MNTASQYATNASKGNPSKRATIVKNQSLTITSAANWEKNKKPKITKMKLQILTVAHLNPTPTKTKMTKSVKLSVYPGGKLEKNYRTAKSFYRANAVNRSLHWKRKPAIQNGPQQEDAQNNLNDCVHAASIPLDKKCPIFNRELQLTDQKPPKPYLDQSQKLTGSNLWRYPWKRTVS